MVTQGLIRAEDQPAVHGNVNGTVGEADVSHHRRGGVFGVTGGEASTGAIDAVARQIKQVGIVGHVQGIRMACLQRFIARKAQVPAICTEHTTALHKPVLGVAIQREAGLAFRRVRIDRGRINTLIQLHFQYRIQRQYRSRTEIETHQTADSRVRVSPCGEIDCNRVGQQITAQIAYTINAENVGFTDFQQRHRIKGHNFLIVTQSADHRYFNANAVK